MVNKCLLNGGGREKKNMEGGREGRIKEREGGKEGRRKKNNLMRVILLPSSGPANIPSKFKILEI